VTTSRQGLVENADSVRLPGLEEHFRWERRRGLAWIDVALPGGRAAFTTRLGGSSRGPYASLNLGILTDDDPDLIGRNRRLLASALGRDPDAVAMGWQVHGGAVQRRSRPPARSAYTQRGFALTRADAQATDHHAVTPLVLTADCVPVALSTPGAVALVHCGWRGVIAGVVEHAVRAVVALSGRVPVDVAAAVGPGIGPCCYEVGEEVRDAFKSRGHTRQIVNEARLDLPRVVVAELELAGLRSGSIFGVELCTSCHPELFYSHRRDGGVTGRQAGLAWLAR
jgi:YfiH family protein